MWLPILSEMHLTQSSCLIEVFALVCHCDTDLWTHHRKPDSTVGEMLTTEVNVGSLLAACNFAFSPALESAMELEGLLGTPRHHSQQPG